MIDFLNKNNKNQAKVVNIKSNGNAKRNFGLNFIICLLAVRIRRLVRLLNP